MAGHGPNVPSWRLPTADPLSWDGVREPYPGPPPRVTLVVHEHTCPDGARVRCLSQWISVTRSTLDRWEVAGYEIATSARAEPPEVRPEFGWLDQLSQLTA